MADHDGDVATAETEAAPARAVSTPKRKAKKIKQPASVEFNLDVIAAEVDDEEVGKPFTFVYGSKEWTLRAAGESDARLLTRTDLSDTQQVMVYLADLLGEEQWNEFPRITLNAALKLLDAYLKFTQGTDLGE